MLNQPTLEKPQVMKLHGMAEAFRAQLETIDTGQLSFEERFVKKSTNAGPTLPANVGPTGFIAIRGESS